MRSSSLIAVTPLLPVGLAVLVAGGALVARLGRLGHGRAVVTACAPRSGSASSPW
jgi:hypothetical protein